MRKMLVLCLLLALVAVPASAQRGKEDWKAFHAYAIQSFGWKCNEINWWHFAEGEFSNRVAKFECDWGKTYYRKVTRTSPEQWEIYYCHKGTCKRF